MAADQAGALTMPLEPPDFDDTLIRRLRPPEVEGSVGDWKSRWLVRLREGPDADSLRDEACRLASVEDVMDLCLTSLDNAEVRLDVRSTSHPLDPEAYPWVDIVLKAIDASLGGIVEINGSPRDFWRTFRPPDAG